MAISERQRQKRLEDKKKKRKLVAKAANADLTLGHKALQLSKYPIHECLVPEGLFETGLGTVIWTRRVPDGRIAISAFIVDVFCLGVKNALFNITSEQEYENFVKPGLTESHDDQEFLPIAPDCARKLIEGAVSYAAELGFSPHRDYHQAKGIFGAADSSACPETFEYGHEGKPFYMRGPRESLSQAKKIVEHLHRKFGEGGYRYMVASESFMAD